VLTARRHEIASAKRGEVLSVKKYVRVLWDGAKKPAEYAPKFVEVDK
jgi:hypothetical protein